MHALVNPRSDKEPKETAAELRLSKLVDVMCHCLRGPNNHVLLEVLVSRENVMRHDM